MSLGQKGKFPRVTQTHSNQTIKSMEINNRAEMVSEAISRVLNNAPVSEILRVYSLAVQHELDKLSDEELIVAVQNAGYIDLVEKYTDMTGPIPAE